MGGLCLCRSFFWFSWYYSANNLPNTNPEPSSGKSLGHVARFFLSVRSCAHFIQRLHCTIHSLLETPPHPLFSYAAPDLADSLFLPPLAAGLPPTSWMSPPRAPPPCPRPRHLRRVSRSAVLESDQRLWCDGATQGVVHST